MRWADEPWVKVYTTDTGDWLALGWEAQALFLLALRKCDRAGILRTGKNVARGLAGMTGMPLEAVERVLPLLLEDGCVKPAEGGLVIPNFIAAQEARTSDAQRKREQRARDRDKAIASGFTGSKSGADELAKVARNEAEGYVYVVQDPDTALVKIGFTTSPDTRLRSILSGRPIMLLRVIDGTIGLERDLHARWAHLRTDGEWFRPAADLLAWACADNASRPVVTPDSHTASHCVTLRREETRLEEKRSSASQEPAVPPREDLRLEPEKPRRARRARKAPADKPTDPRHAPLSLALVALGWPHHGGRTAKALAALLAHADREPGVADAQAEILRRAGIARAWVGFPQARELHELAEKWGHFAKSQAHNGRGPAPPSNFDEPAPVPHFAWLDPPP